MVKPDLQPQTQGEDKPKDKGIVKFSSIIKLPNVQEQFKNLLKERSSQFLASVLNVVTADQNLSRIAQVNSASIIKAAAQAAALDLPIDKNLGYAWLIPYGNEAQFQMGWKGFVQLCLRTGIYKVMSLAYVVNLRKWNPLTEELDADYDEKLNTKEPVGFAFHFSTVNGFQKTAYMTREALLNHGKRFSKAFNSGPWQTDTNAMCAKTLVKMTLSKWGYMSIEMQRAFKVDQAVIRNDDLDKPDAVSYEAPGEEVAEAPEPVKPVIEVTATVNPPATDESKKDEPMEDAPAEEAPPENFNATSEMATLKQRMVMATSTKALNGIYHSSETMPFNETQKKSLYTWYQAELKRISGV